MAAWCARGTPISPATTRTCATPFARTWPRWACPRGAYNVCSGRSATVGEIIEHARRAARVEIRHEVDPARVRAHDVAEVRGSPRLLAEASGWSPAIPLEQTVADALDYWRARL